MVVDVASNRRRRFAVCFQATVVAKVSEIAHAHGPGPGIVAHGAEEARVDRLSIGGADFARVNLSHMPRIEGVGVRPAELIDILDLWTLELLRKL